MQSVSSCPALGASFLVGHQKAGPRSLYPPPRVSPFHRSILQNDDVGNLWVDSSNSIENSLAKQPEQVEGARKELTTYSYDRRIPPGTYVEPRVFNKAKHPNWRRQALDVFQRASLTMDLRRTGVPGRPAQQGPCCVFAGFVEITLDRHLHTRGEVDRMMHAACARKFPCCRAATYEEFLNLAISGLPRTNPTRYNIIFTGPGSELRGPGSLAHLHTVPVRKRLVRPGDSLLREMDSELIDCESYGRFACIAICYSGRIKRQPSLQNFGQLRRGMHSVSLAEIPPSDTKEDCFQHIYVERNGVHLMM